MAILAPGLAKAHYDRILEIHFNRGSQGYEQKVVEYKDLLDKVIDNIQGVDRKTGSQLKGYDFVSSEVRNPKNNHQGSVSPILWNRIQTVRVFRNEIYHNKIRIDYDDYRMCVKAMAKTIEFFSQVPVLDEIVDVYSAGNFTNPSQNVSPIPSVNKPRPTEAVPEGLQYQKTFKGVIITGYTGNADSLVIPSLIEGKEVISIGPSAFIGNNLQRIDLPETLETIGDNAFNSCYQLQQIYLPENVRTIEAYAFYSCANLQTISLPKKLKSIDLRIFDQYSKLKSIYLSKQTKIIGSFSSDVKFIYLD